jgi:predicted Zn-dependent protease
MYNGIVTILKGKLCHYDDNRLQAAQRLMVLFEKYGNPTMLPYNEETAILLSLVADLESKLFEDIALLNLQKWVGNLKRANVNFDKLMSDHRFEYLEKEYPPLRIAKLSTDDTHSRLVELLQAQILINGKSPFSETITILQSFLVLFRKEYSIEFKEKKVKSQLIG